MIYSPVLQHLIAALHYLQWMIYERALEPGTWITVER